MKTLIAQTNPIVGDISENANHILSVIQKYQDHHDLIIFPELALSGYPPQDLLFRTVITQQIQASLNNISHHVKNCYIVIGHPLLQDNIRYNALSIFHQGKLVAQYCKQKLPNYGIFDEKRYFEAGNLPGLILQIKDESCAFLICEDVWQQGPVDWAINNGAENIITINASPFDTSKANKRLDLVNSIAKQGVNVYYCNLVGGQDEWLFDGQSFVMDSLGEITAQAPAFEECYLSIENHKGPVSSTLPEIAIIYKALCLSIADYVHKNGFNKVILGLSGGIDSALTLALAVDALGAENVEGVLMPSRFTEEISNQDALLEASALSIKTHTLPIESVFQEALKILEPVNGHLDWDLTEENMQARIRGLFLMAISNKHKALVLSTSNKSETAVGYSTLYGDMVGAFSPLKDILKTKVYELAQYRNMISPVIPERVITRAPSAELRYNQTDQDSLPPYELLDALIIDIMENNLDLEELVRKGHDKTHAKKVLHLIKINEYKRQQSAKGPKITPRAFGLEWRMPITSGYKSI